MNHPKVMEWKKSRDFWPGWTIRRKLATGFSALILIAVVSGIAIWPQLQSVSEITDALRSLNSIAKNTQYLAHDGNAYMLGHPEHREEFNRHAKDFNDRWQAFVTHQTNHGGAPEHEQAIMDKIQALSESYFVNGESLFDTYDNQKIAQQRLSQNVNQTLQALNPIVTAHKQQYSDHDLISSPALEGSDALAAASGDFEIYSDLRLDLVNLIMLFQGYLLGNNNKIDAINQRVIEFQASVELFIAHVSEETSMTNRFGAQVDVIHSNYLQIGGDILGLIKLRSILDKLWQAANVTGENLDDRVSDLVRIHDAEIESTRIESTEFALFVIISAILVGIGASIFVGNMITAPIIALTDAVRDFGEGERNHRVEVLSGDETGELGLAFNQMADDINAYQAKLENVRGNLIRSERLAVLGALIGTVSHEIRNPLGTIRTAIYAIRKRLEGQNAGVTNTLNRAERGIDRCDSIIEDLLNYSRSPRLKMERTLIDDWVGETLGAPSIDPSINLTFKLEAGAFVQLDKLQFQDCLLNTVNNACQSMLGDGEQGKTRNLAVNTSNNKDEVIIQVIDSGSGISAENLEKIFEPMFSTRTFGVGLGLPVVKKVMEQHNGQVEIDSQLGKGTTVTLRLPKDKTEES